MKSLVSVWALGTTQPSHLGLNTFKASGFAVTRFDTMLKGS